MGLLDTEYSTVNAKKPRNSDRIQPGQPMNMRGLLDAATSIPVAGDALSGGMALYDAAKGDYGSAAMNALGLLPFVSAGTVKGVKNTAKMAVDRNTSKLTEFEQRHITAQKNAALPVEKGGLGLPVNNTAMQRADAMGAEFGWGHGSPNPNITELRSSKIGAEGRGAYASDYMPETNTYAGNAEGATVYPLAILKGKAFNSGKANPYDALGASGDDELAKKLLQNGNDGIVRTQEATPQWLIDAGGLAMPERNHYVSETASNFRSPFAAFDPMRRHEADLLGNATPEFMSLLAGGGLLGLGGYSLMSEK